MANYELPQVRVFQDLEPSIEPSERQMLPALIGQRRDLFMYDQTAEEDSGKIGNYKMTEDLLAAWAGLGANSTVLTNTVRIYGEDLRVSLVKAGFLDDVDCLSPLHEDFDPIRYFTPITDKQENVLLFESVGAGGVITPAINLAGNDLYRTPEVGDYVKVRQESADTLQDEDWTAQVISLVETEALRSNDGIGTPEEDASNTFNPSLQGTTAYIPTPSPGDVRLGVEYKVVALQDIAEWNSTIEQLSKYYGRALNKACSNGIFSLDDLGYKVRINNVSQTDLDLSIQSKDGNRLVEGIALEQFVKCAVDPAGNNLWFESTGELASGSSPVDAEDVLGGYIVDDLFLVYAVPNKELNATDAEKTNNVVTLNLPNTGMPVDEGDYVVVHGFTDGYESINGRFRVTGATETSISYDDPGVDIIASGTGHDSGAVYLSPVKNDSFEISGSLERPAQVYNGTGSDAPAVVSGSEFDAIEDTVYTVEVVEGGALDTATTGEEGFYPDVTLRISSDTSLDPAESVKPVIQWDGVSTGDGSTTDISVGLRGVKIKFNATPGYAKENVSGTLLANRTGDVATISGAIAHGLQVGDLVTITCETDASFNVNDAIITYIPDSSSFEYTSVGNDTTADDPCTAIAAAAGTFRPIAFSKGDMWSIKCIGRSGDQVVGVITDKKFEYFEADSPTQRLDLEFMEEIPGQTEIPRLKVTESSLENWEINFDNPDDGLTYDLRFISGASYMMDDLEAELMISEGEIFMAYEAVNNSNTGQIVMVTDASDPDDEIGPDDPCNPLGYGVRKALLNARGVPVLAVSVDEMADEDIDDVLALLSQTNNAYQITPLTFDESIQNKVIAHVLSMSTELMDLWRRAYISTPIGSEYGIVTVDADNNDVVGMFVENGGVYNKLVLDPSVTGVSFVDANVKAGYTVRHSYAEDMYGNVTYHEFTVLSVINATELLVLGDFGSTSQTIKVGVYKDTSSDDVIYEVGGRSQGINSRRVTNVFPPVLVDDNGEAVPGYFGAAALAGLAAGSEPHQGHTNSKLLGFSEASTLAPMRRMDVFAMNELAGTGVTIVTGEASNIGIRHELTTAMIDRKNRETMTTRNLDSLSYTYFDALSPFIGIANVTPEFVTKIRTELTSIGNYIIASSRRPLIGSQMTAVVTNSVEQDPVLADKVNIYLSPVLPLPFNYGDIHLQI